MSKKILGSVQPSYLSWLPFFERMRLSDVFVYLDDVEYSKNSFHNRNRIKTSQGPLTLTVPVLYKGNSKAKLCEIGIDQHQPWALKHWKSIEQNYKKAPYFNELADGIRQILFKARESLADLNIALIERFRVYLGVQTPCYRSSRIAVEGTANMKLVNLCRHFEATHFMVKPGTDDYHPAAFFKEHSVEFEYFDPPERIYPQLFGEFVGGLSILDYAMNCGPGSFLR